MSAQAIPFAGDQATVANLRAAAKHLGVGSIRDGSWFRRIVAAHVKSHCEKIDAGHWDRVYPGIAVEQRAHQEIRKVAVKAAAAGAVASAGASAGELLSLFTDGLAAPVGIPATMLSMALEAAYTALLQIDLACDLGAIYGIPFNPDDVGEIATLFGLALEVDVYSKKEQQEQDEADAPHGLTSRLIRLEEGEIATRIGRKLLEDSVVRNIIPIIGVPISARWNYVATTKLGAKVRKYMRYRRALATAVARLQLGNVTDPTLLVEGAWLLATTDGAAGHEEMLAIAAIMDLLTPVQRSAIAADKAFGDHEEDWFAELAAVDRKMHEPLLETLSLVAAADRELAVPERRLLTRIGKALGREIDFARIEQICAHLAHGDELPEMRGRAQA
jgi:hypothetical protein